MIKIDCFSLIFLKFFLMFAINRSLNVRTPRSAKFSGRKDKGKVLFSTSQSEKSLQELSQSQDIDQSIFTQSESWTRKDPMRLVSVEHYYKEHLTANAHFMYSRTSDKVNGESLHAPCFTPQTTLSFLHHNMPHYVFIVCPAHHGYSFHHSPHNHRSVVQLFY